MMRYQFAAVLGLAALAISACAPSPPVPQSPGSGAIPARPERTLVAAVRVEPESLALRPVLAGLFASFTLVRRFFNADLVVIDDRGNPRPYLTEVLPSLNTDSWRVLPDGQMETTWRFRPNIVWQDGTPFSAEDVVFAWHVYATPEFASGQAIRAIADVTAPDDRTMVIRWRQPYPNANSLVGNEGLPPLPRHLLEQAFQQADPTAFAQNPFWTRGYVGLGPYRMGRWEQGSFFEGAAFPQHVLGAPAINRIKVLFIGDANTALSYLLAGELDLGADSAIGPEQGVTLNTEWERTRAGFIVLVPSNWQATAFQLRPELANPHGILDVRVRKALAHTLDKQALSDGVYHGQIAVSEFMISPLSRWGPAFQNAVLTYPYDLRRSEQLMNEAGYAKGPDGAFNSPSEGRFKSELKTSDSPDWVAEMTIMANDWRKAGFDIVDAVLPAALSNDPASRVTFPGMFTSITSQGEGTLNNYTMAQIPRAENNWRGGNNRGGWASPDYDRVLQGFTATLEPSARSAQLAELARIFTDDLPMISLLFQGNPYAHIAALHGPAVTAPESAVAWNVHEWSWAD